ncbi:GntR family transcriptional regulator YhfZ [Alicyclobacillus shizuokensis]|uniref:GntR family transcriptional regulator YhfZ n=1 Tax=Alicyclobacillus shizuokensis TaxID=392014 RepID=UPI0012ED53CB|nr:GntR family transcriptional regulator YhfZ [Alicyclobacillus shizuokensis]
MREAELFSRNGLAVRSIARKLLECEPGSRIPRVQDFAAKCEVGRGTVQSALQLLVDAGAVGLDSRGHLGTFLVAADFAKLWEFAGQSNLVGAMPLPYSRRYEGLASGLYAAFEGQNIPFHLSYMRGGANRVKALCQGRYDIVVTSVRAADVAAQDQPIAILHSFGPGSYVGAHGLLVRNPEWRSVQPGMRIGVDSTSVDQYTLTMEVCRDVDVEFVELPYMQLFEQLLHGKIDAAVWNIDEVEQRYGRRGPVSIVPLEFREDDATEAALVVRREDLSIFQNLLKTVDLNQVTTIQQAVLAGTSTPHY